MQSSEPAKPRRLLRVGVVLGVCFLVLGCVLADLEFVTPPLMYPGFLSAFSMVPLSAGLLLLLLVAIRLIGERPDRLVLPSRISVHRSTLAALLLGLCVVLWWNTRPHSMSFWPHWFYPPSEVTEVSYGWPFRVVSYSSAFPGRNMANVDHLAWVLFVLLDALHALFIAVVMGGTWELFRRQWVRLAAKTP
jgi:hypothetical protein